MRYSKNKDFIRYVAALVKSGEWIFIPKGRSKHGFIRHLASSATCPVPGSPGGNPCRFLNFKTQIRRLARAAQA